MTVQGGPRVLPGLSSHWPSSHCVRFHLSWATPAKAQVVSWAQFSLWELHVSLGSPTCQNRRWPSVTLSLARAPHRPPCLHPDPPRGPCGSSRLSPRPCASRLQFILCAFRGNLPKMSILSRPLSQNCKPSGAAPSAPCAPVRNEVRCVRNQRLPEPLGARLRCIIVSRLFLLASTDWIFQDGDLHFVKRELRGASAGGLC